MVGGSPMACIAPRYICGKYGNFSVTMLTLEAIWEKKTSCIEVGQDGIGISVSSKQHVSC